MTLLGKYALEFEELGKGAFGIVYKGVNNETREDVAAKKIRYRERGEEENEVCIKIQQFIYHRSCLI